MSHNQISKSFHAWLPWLSWFDESLQPIVADLLLQLNTILGPIKESQWNDQKLLSGLGDLRRRGSYEHLLSSEWVIAEEEPDEFIRRAISYEHLFLTPMQEKSQANNVIIALFDSSVLQLGVQRLVHLILMLLLDIRSHNHNSQFYWGAIRNYPDLKLFNSIDDLSSLLKQRTTILTTEDMINDWQSYFEESALIYDECWLVGTTFTNVSFATHHVNIERLIKSYDKLWVEIKSASMTRNCHLTLPNDIICAKMLSGQFVTNNGYAEIEKNSLVPINTHFLPVISMNGNHVLTFNHDNTNAYFLSLADALSAKQVCRIQYYYLNSCALGFDFQGKRILSLLYEQQTFFLWQPNKAKYELNVPFELNDKDPLFSFVWLYTNHGSNILVVDSNQTLFSLYWQPKLKEKITEYTHIDGDVVKLFKLNDRFALYIKYDDQQICLKSPQLSNFNYRLKDIEQRRKQQFYIAAEQLWMKGFGLLAVGYEQQWLLFSSETEHISVTIPDGWQVFGLIYHTHENRTDFLMINQDKKQVSLFDYSNNRITECYRSSSKIVSYVYSSLAKSFSVTNEKNELILYSFLTQSIRLKLSNTN